eukprot:UN00579
MSYRGLPSPYQVIFWYTATCRSNGRKRNDSNVLENANVAKRNLTMNYMRNQASTEQTEETGFKDIKSYLT